MDAANVSFDLTKLVLAILTEYGMAGVFGLALFYWVKTTQQKLDTLNQTNHKLFGALMALIDKKDRDDLDKKE